jgi:glycosyltransferase involved in cell wall biosynthesis
LTVILSDSGSTDGTCDVIPREFPWTVLVQGNSQWWWTKATNEGIKYALGQAAADDYILTINNDVSIPPDYVEAMVHTAVRYPRSVVGSLIRDVADRCRLVECGSYINWRTMKYHFLELDELDETGFSEKLLFMCGKGVLYPVRVFLEHGLFDEATLPHYRADQDFVALCKKWGYALRIQTRVPLYSREDITAPGAQDMQTFLGKLKLFVSRKSKVNVRDHFRIMFRHCPRRYWCTSAILLTGRLLGHVFIKQGVQRGPVSVGTPPQA